MHVTQAYDTRICRVLWQSRPAPAGCQRLMTYFVSTQQIKVWDQK